MGNFLKRKLIKQQLSGSDPILKTRALQSICDGKDIYRNDTQTINQLVQLIKDENHPKVVRWLAYTLALVGSGETPINALERKIKTVTNNEVIEWIIASTERLKLPLTTTNICYPAELVSREEFDIGVIKSWGYKEPHPELINFLVSALSHEKSYVRKWAALSLGNKNLLPKRAKEALIACFDDDDYLVREWSMYAVKNFATDVDYNDYAKALIKEDNNRVREWIVKSLPYTYHNDVPSLIANETKHPYFTTDPLYAEAVISALGRYTDIESVCDKMITVVGNNKNDLVVLSAIKNLLKSSYIISSEQLFDVLVHGFHTVQNFHIKTEIGMYLVDQFTPNEKLGVYNVLKNESKANALQVLSSKIGIELLKNSIEYQKDDLVESDVKVFTEVIDHLIQKPRSSLTQHIFISGGINIMRDQYNVKQAGAVGPGSHSENSTFNNVIQNDGDTLNFIQLTEELQLLRQRMVNEAKVADEFVAIGEIAKAEICASKKDTVGLQEHLKVAGKWAFDAATQIGTSLTAELIKKSIGL